MSLFQIRPFPAEDGPPASSAAGHNPGPMESAGPAMGSPAVAVPSAQEPVTKAQLNALLAERDRQVQASNQQMADLHQRLVRLAETLCPAAVDVEVRRSGQSLENWPPERLVGFIADHARGRLLQADRASGQYAALQLAYSALLAERAARAVPGPPASLPAAAPTAEAEGVIPKPAVANPPITQAHPDQTRVDDVVRLLAATGLVRGTRIREHLAALWGVDRRGRLIHDALEAAAAAGYLDVRPVKADWPGAPAQFYALSRAGCDHAARLGCTLVPAESLGGQQRGLAPEVVSLVLQAAELLSSNGYVEVTAFPVDLSLPDGVTYVPCLSAKDSSGARIYVECERERVVIPREARWRLAARAGGGVLHLVVPSPNVQERLATEINLVRVHTRFSLLACNVADYLKGRRGVDGTIWTYRRQD